MKGHVPKFYVRLSLFILLIGAVPVLILSLSICARFQPVFSAYLIQSRMEALSQVRMRIDTIFKIVDYTAAQFLDSGLVAQALESPLGYQEYPLYQQLQENMNKIQIYDLGIQDVLLVNQSQNWIVCNKGRYRLDTFSQRDSLEAFYTSSSTSYWNLSLYRNAGIGTGQSLCLVKRVPINSLDSQNLFIADLSGDALERNLRNHGDGYYGILINGKKLFPDDGLPLEIAERIALSDRQSGSIHTKINGAGALVAYETSSYSGLVFYSVSDMKDWAAAGWNAAAGVFLACAVILALTAAFGIFGSNRIYAPVQRLISSLPEGGHPAGGKLIVDEFTLLQERVGALIHDKSALQQTVESQMEQLRGMFVRRLLAGEADAGGSLDDKMKLFYPAVHWKWMCILNIEIDAMDPGTYQPGDMDLMIFGIHNIAEELIPSDQRLYPLIIHYGQVTLVGGNDDTEDAFQHRIRSMAEQLHSVIESHLKIKHSIGISRVFTSFDNTHEAYLESREALRYRIRLGENLVVSIEDVNLRQSRWIPSRELVDLEKKLTDAICLLDRERISPLLHSCLSTIFQEPLDFSMYQLQLNCLLGAIASTVSGNGDALAPISRKPLQEEFSSLGSVEELGQWFHQSVLEPVLASLEEQRQIDNRRISQMVTEYIATHLEDEITLESCAAAVKYHPNYVSRAFKEQQGISYSEYLQNCRIDAAKKWLSQTDMKITEISKRLQYCNPQNFIRCFKKIVGMTPGQYRDGYRKKSSRQNI